MINNCKEIYTWEDVYNYIYFFYDSNNNLLYIGKTGNLINRLKCHFSKSNVELEPWKLEVDKNKIIIYRCKSDTDLEVYETYFINKYNPKYNIEKVFNDYLTFELPYLEPRSLKEEYEKAKEVVEFINTCNNSMILNALLNYSNPNFLTRYGNSLQLTKF